MTRSDDALNFDMDARSRWTGLASLVRLLRTIAPRVILHLRRTCLVSNFEVHLSLSRAWNYERVMMTLDMVRLRSVR